MLTTIGIGEHFLWNFMHKMFGIINCLRFDKGLSCLPYDISLHCLRFGCLPYGLVVPIVVVSVLACLRFDYMPIDTPHNDWWSVD